MTVDVLSESESIALVRGTTAGHRSTDEEGQLVELARLCARLPLALRIAAERAAARPLMPLTELIADLRDESALWDALSAEDDDEADAVRTVFAWSYRALPTGVARLFRLLGLHPGPEFGVSAAAALAASTPTQARHWLDVLVGAHLVEQIGPDRYQFHDLLRAYAVDQAHHDDTPDDRQTALLRLLDWYLYSADAAARAVSPQGYALPVALDPHGEHVAPLAFDGYAAAIGWYDAERSNLLAAVPAAIAVGAWRVAWQIPAVLSAIYVNRDAPDVWLDPLQVAARAAHEAGDHYGRAVTLDNLAIAYRQAQDLTRAAEHYRAALRSFQQIEHDLGQARAANGLGLVYRRLRRLDDAREQFERAMRVARAVNDRTLTGLVLLNLGHTWLDLDDLDRAGSCLREGADTLREAGENLYEAEALSYLGTVYRHSGELARARATVAEALAIARDFDNRTFEAVALLELGRIELAEDRVGEALATLQCAAGLFRRAGRPSREAEAWTAAGQAYGQQGQWQQAIAFHQRAAAAHQDLDDKWQQALALDQLATALAHADRREEAHESWRQATALLAQFPDAYATQLRDRINAELDAS
jgi:tetratricopeptide (TPR) repeat protein